MTDEMAGLPEDVREHVANMDAHNTVNGSWNAVRAELLRLARENADLHKTFDAKTVHVSIPSPTMYAEFENYARPFKQRAERAEAELAALKRRIAEAATGIAKRSLAPSCLVIEGFDDDPGDYHNERVALLPVGGEGEH